MAISNKKEFLKDCDIPSKFPFPYTPEKFTKSEKKILSNYFTNWDKPVFAIHNLPQEVIGAMFSRYSRTAKSVRRLFLDEFWSNELVVAKNNKTELRKARERTNIFYQKVFAEYGDDSVIQMGSVHISFEFVSQIHGAKAVEDQRVASAYIEKSTRYVDFGSNLNGHYLFMEPPEIMDSRFKKDFVLWNKSLFDAYSKYLPQMLDYLRGVFPLEKQMVEDSKSGKRILFSKLNNETKLIVEAAHNRALKAKALDTIRFFLPLTTVTNLGAHFSGHAAETAINKMLVSPYAEARLLGAMALNELQIVSPNFLQNINHPFGVIARDYRREVRSKMEAVSEKWEKKNDKKIQNGDDLARIIDYDRDADVKIASEIIFTGSSSASKKEIVDWARKIKKKEGKIWSPTLLKIIKDAVPNRKTGGRSRRQKLPRAFEHAYAEIEFYTDIGAYKDLQRNRLSSTERKFISASDLFIPEEYKDEKLKELLSEYLKLAKTTKVLQEKMCKVKKLKYASEYVAMMGNKVRYSVRANLRQWTFFAELRTISGGHPTYRKALQAAAREIIRKIPFTESLFANIDWTEDYGLGRMKAEIYTQERLSKLK